MRKLAPAQTVEHFGPLEEANGEKQRRGDQMKESERSSDLWSYKQGLIISFC